jgi:hypothetical protein
VYPGRPVALALRADLRVEVLLLVFGFLLFLLWRTWLLRRRRSLVLRLRLRAWRRSLRANRRRSAFFSYDRGRLVHGGLNLLMDRRSRAHRGLNLLMGRRSLVDRWLNLLMHRRSLVHRGLDLLADRRRLAHRGLDLLADRRNILRTGGRDGLGRWVLGPPRTSLGLGWALGKGRRRAGAHGRGDRMNLFRVNRLDLYASGRLVLAGDLGAQSLQLRGRYGGPGMLL